MTSPIEQSQGPSALRSDTHRAPEGAVVGDLWFERLSKAMAQDDPVSFYGLHAMLSGEPPLNCLLSDAAMAVKALGSLDAHVAMMLRPTTTASAVGTKRSGVNP